MSAEQCAAEALRALQTNRATHIVGRVNRLIEGFETPYGLELLASVHWLAAHERPPAEDKEDAIKGIATWNERKHRMFRPEHIRLAWDRLGAEQWIK